MESIFLEWPDSAQKDFDSTGRDIVSLSDAYLAIRSGKVSHNVIESYLLGSKSLDLISTQDRLIALCCLHFSRIELCSFRSILEALRSECPERLEVRILTIVLWLWSDDIPAIVQAPSSIWFGIENSISLRICKSYFLLKTDNSRCAALDIENIDFFLILQG